MRKIFLEDLPLNKNGNVNWKNSVGCKVRFIYDEISGVIEILEYDNKKYYITVKYKDRIRDIFVGSFKKCLIQELIGIRHSEYKFNIGDIVYDRYLIKEQSTVPHAKTRNINSKFRSGNNKAYVIKCLNCNHIFTISEDVFNNKKRKNYCPACNVNPKKVIKGFNDIWTTNPELAKKLLNPDDGYKYTQSSNKKVDWVCSNCGSIIKNKTFNNVNKHGLFCKMCDDRITYPEKIMRECLFYNNINFEMHKVFEWSNKKEYDFYLSDYNMIIETHGSQHYKNSFEKIGGRTLNEEQNNDIYKENIAKENGIKKYIIINCMKSDFDYIYNNIKNSELKSIIDFENINEKEIFENTMTNYLIKVCSLWNSGIHDIYLICNEVKLSEYTIVDYLKRCSKIGICDYIKTVKNKQIKSVKCLTTGEIFKSMADAERKYNIQSCAIRKSCLNNKYSAGKINGKDKLYWQYVD